MCLPHARLVADLFLVIQHVRKAVNKVFGVCAKRTEGKKALESQRHLFLRNSEDLSLEEELTLSTFAQAFPEIAVAGPLKEAVRTWYATASATTAATEFDAWIRRKRERPAELRKALSAFRNWRQEILAFFDFLPTRIRNRFVEGKNNLTKALMRQRYQRDERTSEKEASATGTESTGTRSF